MFRRLNLDVLEKMKIVTLPDGHPILIFNILFTDYYNHVVTLYVKGEEPYRIRMSQAELEALLGVLERYGVLLVSDEIHEDFVFERDAFVPVLRLAESEDARVLSLTSASKTFNLAGLQQAAAFCRNAALLSKLKATMHAVGVVQGNIFGMIATEAAFAHGDEWLDAMLAYIRKGERLFRAELSVRLPKAVLSPLEATYLGWIDLRAYGLGAAELTRRCRAAGVEFTPGTFFGEKAGDGFLRINLACPHGRIRLAAQQLENAIKEQ